MPTSGKLVKNIPKAIGSSKSGSNCLTIARYIKIKEIRIITDVYKRQVSMSLNGSLAGLVAITAGCDAVSPIGAAIIGAVAGILIVLGVEFIDKVLKIDDPVGAVGVHCVNGAFGTLAVGLLADGSTTDKGLFYGGGLKLLGTQALGVVCVAAWVAVTMIVTFTVIKKTMGLRASAEEERCV